MVELYCLKCKAKREVENTQELTTAKGNRKYLKGVCPICGTNCAKMLGKV
jgi:hypothetical protein